MDTKSEGVSVKPTRCLRMCLEKSRLSSASLAAALMCACSFSSGSGSPPLTKLPCSYNISSILLLSRMRRKPARHTFAAPSQTGELGAAPVVLLRPGVQPRIGALESDYKRTRFRTSVADLVYREIAVSALARCPVAKTVRELTPEPERSEFRRGHDRGRVARVVAPAVSSKPVQLAVCARAGCQKNACVVDTTAWKRHAIGEVSDPWKIVIVGKLVHHR